MPPKASQPDVEKMLTLSYKEYMESQNEIVNAINQHYNMASTMMMASSRSMQTIMAAMFRVRESAKTILANSGLSESSEGLEQYPALANLLQKDSTMLMNPMSTTSIGDLGAGLTALTGEKKQKRKRAPKNPDAPKRPQTAFFLYLEANRDSVKSELGDDSKPGDVAKLMRQRWVNLSETEKEVYRVMYRANFEGYKHEVEEFKASGGKVADADLNPTDEDAVLEKPSDKADAAGDDSDEPSSESSEESGDEKTPTPEPAPPAKKGRKAAAAKAPAKTAAVKKAEAAAVAAAAKVDTTAKSAEKQTAAEKKKAKAAAAAAIAVVAPPASTPAEKKKGKETAKSSSPEESRKTAAAESPETGKKKRKSTGPELEEKRKKRKEAHGDDF